MAEEKRARKETMSRTSGRPRKGANRGDREGPPITANWANIFDEVLKGMGDNSMGASSETDDARDARGGERSPNRGEERVQKLRIRLPCRVSTATTDEIERSHGGTMMGPDAMEMNEHEVGDISGFLPMCDAEIAVSVVADEDDVMREYYGSSSTMSSSSKNVKKANVRRSRGSARQQRPRKREDEEDDRGEMAPTASTKQPVEAAVAKLRLHGGSLLVTQTIGHQQQRCDQCQTPLMIEALSDGAMHWRCPKPACRQLFARADRPIAHAAAAKGVEPPRKGVRGRKPKKPPVEVDDKTLSKNGSWCR